MSKIKFGNFITYNGKFLSTAIQKAQSGNLVFARITNSPKADIEFKASVEVNATPEAPIWFKGVEQKADFTVNNVNKDGYYIFGGKADGHLVTYEVFKALKEEVAALNTKVGDLSIGEGESKVTYKDVPAYVAAYVDSRLKALEAYNVKDVKVGNTSIAVDGVVILGNAAQKNVAAAIATGASGLATAGQVADAVKDVQDAVDAIPTYGVSGSANISVKSTVGGDKINFELDITDKVATKDYVNTQVSKIDGVMEFKGTVTALPVVTKDSTDYNPGDVVVFNGEEYVLDKDYKWVEIGKVGIDDAVTSAKGSTYVSVAGNGENDEKRGNITISVVTSAIAEGATGLATAADVYAAVKAAKDAATVTGASGYLMVDKDKNVVVDAAQVELGATGTSTKLVTLGYVEGQLENLGNDINDAKTEAAKHSSVVSKSEDYIGVTGVTTENGSVEYQVSLKADALKAAKHSISEILVDGKSATTADTVQAALQDLFESDKVAAEGLTNLNDRLEAHIGATQAHAAANITFAGATGATTTNVEEALEDLYAQIATLNSDVKDASEITYTAGTGVTTGEGVDKVNEALDDLYKQFATLGGAAVTDVKGDEDSYSKVESSKDDEHIKIVKNVLADNVVREDGTTTRLHGLVTDEYLDEVLAWEELTDSDSFTDGPEI